MNPFEQHNVAHLSPSSINAWMAAPSLWIMERLLGKRGNVGCAAYRGTATEAGVSAGLFDHAMSVEDCVAAALPVYDRLSALSGDTRREKERDVIPGMVREGLALREHGVPIRPNSGDQHRIEIRLEGVDVPVIGFLDWLYADEVIDLKSTLRVPSEMSAPNLRQAAVYKTANMDRRVRFFYVSDKRSAKHTLTREQYDVAMNELTRSAQRLQRFLAISTDAQELAALVPHTSDSFYFGDPGTKAHALEVYGF